MSVLRRVLLLLCVAVLLREGSSNSPLDILWNLKNKIFASSNSSESMEQPSQCSGSDQDGVCNMQNVTANVSLEEINERFNDTDTDGTPTSVLTEDQLLGNETVVEEADNTNNTQQYSEQEWNSTANNITDNHENDFEYSENAQNGTEYTSEVNVEEINNQTENTRRKRQVNKEEQNFSLDTAGATSTPLDLSTTVPKEASENSSVNQSSNSIGGKETISALNNTINTNNESITTNVVKTIEENATVSITGVQGNETEENLVNEQKTYELSNSTSDSFKDLAALSSNNTGIFNELPNATDDTNVNEIIVENCTDCVAGEENMGLQNISMLLNGKLNGTEFMDSELDQINKIITQINSSTFPNITSNITKLKDILENSTRIIEKIVQNIIPATAENNETDTHENNGTALENTGFQSSKTTQEKNNFQQIEGKSRGEIYADVNSTSSQTYIPKVEDVNITTDSLDRTSDMNQTIEIESNLNESTELGNYTTDKVRTKRAKRSLNFTILSESEEEPESSVSTFPETTEPELPSSRITNSAESNSLNRTEGIEIVGPICLKRYEPCTNSSDCCEDYECLGADVNNSTLYCDLPPVNFSLSTYLPQTVNKTA